MVFHLNGVAVCTCHLLGDMLMFTVSLLPISALIAMYYC